MGALCNVTAAQCESAASHCSSQQDVKTGETTASAWRLIFKRKDIMSNGFAYFS